MDRRIALVLMTATIAACGGGGGDGDPGAGSADFGLGARVAPSLTFPLGSPFEVAYPGVSFDRPLMVAAAPGDDGHLYVAEQGGIVWVFERRENVTVKSVFLDLTDRTRANGEQGLLGLAFDPDYASNGYVYVNYSANHDPDVGAGDSVTARFTDDHTTRPLNRSTGVELLRLGDDPYSNHNGGAIAFGNDGMLYIATGDGGSGGDPENRAQDLGSPLGKILRIRRNGRIPADNPFVGTPGARGEIWAYGLRNPFRMSFDRVTGRLWAGDVGQNAWEEIDLIEKGGNYGWRKFEGTHVYNDADPTPPGAIMPVFEYDHDAGYSVTGGRVYRGSRLPALVGKYVYGDFGSGRVWALTESGGAAVSNVQIGTVPNPSSFGEDVDGELLITSFDGRLHRLVADEDQDGEPPSRLSATGIFSDVADLVPSAGVVEYTVSAPFWSDGTSKQRWIAVPGTSADIGFSASGAWTFPRGTVIVKHFQIGLADGTRKPLETRVLLNQTGGWRGFTYRWNDAGTDATLLAGPATVDLEVTDPASPTGTRTIRYEFPDRGACPLCHTSAAGSILGVRTKQLNRTFSYPGGVLDNQLRALEHAGYFDRDIADPATYGRLPDIGDAGDSEASRARAYLDVNCSQCHRPGGPTGVNMDLRFETATAGMHTHDVVPVGESYGVPDARRIAPGDRSRSLVWTRMHAEDGPERMPPIATHRVDEAGAALVGNWIDAGAPGA